jgi:hypothetical protein
MVPNRKIHPPQQEKKVKVKVTLRGLFSTAALEADCTLAPDVVLSFISRSAITSTSEGRKQNKFC